MGSISSGRHPYYGGALKQVGMKFPTSSEWFHLAKRICHYRGISFNEFVRTLVQREVIYIKDTKMWPCKCRDSFGKALYWFKRTQHCNQCDEYQLEIYKNMGRKANQDLNLLG